MPTAIPEFTRIPEIGLRRFFPVFESASVYANLSSLKEQTIPWERSDPAGCRGRLDLGPASTSWRDWRCRRPPRFDLVLLMTEQSWQACATARGRPQVKLEGIDDRVGNVSCSWDSWPIASVEDFWGGEAAGRSGCNSWVDTYIIWLVTILVFLALFSANLSEILPKFWLS